MEDNPFNRLSPVNGKIFWKHGKQNAGQKNPGHYQKNFDHRETKYSSQTDIIKHALTKKENFIENSLLYM